MRAIISAIIGIITLIVGLRFALLLIGANPANALVDWIYDVSSPLVAPFAGIIGTTAVIADGAVVQSVFEWASLIALLVYALLGSILMRVMGGTARRA